MHITDRNSFLRLTRAVCRLTVARLVGLCVFYSPLALRVFFPLMLLVIFSAAIEKINVESKCA